MVAANASNSTAYPTHLLDLAGRTAVVTGGSSGIGAATATLIGSLGARVAVIDPVATDNVDCWVGADVSSSQSVRAAFAEIRKSIGPVSVLVNNAGMAPKGRFESLNEDEWQRTLAVNLTSVFLCTQAALPDLRDRGGVVTNVASIAGRHRSMTASAAYSAAKGGVIALTRHLAAELAPDGVRVNCVCPGLVETRIMRNNLDDESRTSLTSAIPLQRLATPDEVASTIAFLVSSASSYMTGSIVDVNGGLV